MYGEKNGVRFFPSLNNPIDEISSINFMRQNQRFLISTIFYKISAYTQSQTSIYMKFKLD